MKLRMLVRLYPTWSLGENGPDFVQLSRWSSSYNLEAYRRVLGNKLYNNDRHGRECTIFTDSHLGSKHEKAMIGYTVQDPNGQLKLRLLDLDALARDSAQMRKLFMEYPEQNKAVDDIYERTDIITG
ncbi:hypothetical protein F5880DRAFT_1512577 [Lentinula raphanica]|nr:hypothetical protein F5880DRAFT_1512577 [Lentinula raphanica]